MRKQLAAWLRKAADRLDYAGAPRRTSWSLRFTDHWGAVFSQEPGAGCPLWYMGDADYGLAHLPPAPPGPCEVAWVTIGVPAPDGSVSVLGSAQVASAETTRRMTGFDVIPVPGSRRPAQVPRWRVTLTAELDGVTSLPGPGYSAALTEMFRRQGAGA